MSNRSQIQDDVRKALVGANDLLVGQFPADPSAYEKSNDLNIGFPVEFNGKSCEVIVAQGPGSVAVRLVPGGGLQSPVDTFPCSNHRLVPLTSVAVLDDLGVEKAKVETGGKTEQTFLSLLLTSAGAARVVENL